MSKDETRAEMQERWRKFASEDPMYYIGLAGKDTTPEEFFAEGGELSASLVEWLDTDPPRGRMLEIGCGLGRMLRHFAPAFDQVDGIDIAEEMVEGARKMGLPPNVSVTAGTGAGLDPFGDDQFDFVFSYQVFQHIPDASIIEGYLQEVARVLKPQGQAVLHYDTRPMSLVARLYFALPDQLQRRSHREFIRRYRREPEWLREAMRRSGLTVRDERGEGTTDHFFLLSH